MFPTIAPDWTKGYESLAAINEDWTSRFAGPGIYPASGDNKDTAIIIDNGAEHGGKYRFSLMVWNYRNPLVEIAEWLACYASMKVYNGKSY